MSGRAALYLTERQAAEANARRRAALQAQETEPERRPYLYFLETGGRTIVVANAADQRWRIPEDELHAMAEEAGAKVNARQQPRTEATNAALQSYWGDWLQFVREHQRGRTSFGPATFANRRWRSREGAR